MTTAHPAQRVSAGIALLTRELPDWRSRVTQRVNLISDKRCVLGQCYGSFHAGMKALFGSYPEWDSIYRELQTHGFLVAGTGEDLPVLQNLWNATVFGDAEDGFDLTHPHKEGP